MKTIWTAGLLALGVISLSQQQASAWINTKFGFGVNLGWQSGGNTLGWGAVRGAQPPGPEYSPAFPDFNFYQPPSHPVYGHAMDGPAPVPTAVKPSQAPTQNNAYYYNQPNYQTVTFPGYYTMPNYYYPATYYYYGR